MTPEALKRKAKNVADLRRLAKRALPAPVFDFTDGGAEDERTLRRNEAAFADYAFLPRPLNGAAKRDLTVELFGRRLSMPVMIGPTGLSGLLWPDGEQCAARAAAAAGTGFCLSHGSACTIEDLAHTGAAPRWMQIFVYKDRSFTREFIERAARSEYDGLVLTVDNQFPGNRERDIRNGFTIPPNLGPREIALMAAKPGWLWRMRKKLRDMGFANYVRDGKKVGFARRDVRVTDLLDPGLSFADIDEIRRVWKGPFLLKGVLHPEEARIAVDRGVDGIIVSNHGGRQLDGAASGLDALPGVVAAVGGRVPVLVDGGVRRGADVVKALALGARACLIARPHLWALAIAGEPGVRHVLEIFRSEIDRAMGHLGAARIADLGPDLLLPRPGEAQRPAPVAASVAPSAAGVAPEAAPSPPVKKPRAPRAKPSAVAAPRRRAKKD